MWTLSLSYLFAACPAAYQPVTLAMSPGSQAAFSPVRWSQGSLFCRVMKSQLN